MYVTITAFLQKCLDVRSLWQSHAFLCVFFQFLPSFLQWEQKQLIGEFLNFTLHPNMKVNVSFQPAGYVNIYVDVWAVNVS